MKSGNGIINKNKIKYENDNINYNKIKYENNNINYNKYYNNIYNIITKKISYNSYIAQIKNSHFLYYIFSDYNISSHPKIKKHVIIYNNKIASRYKINNGSNVISIIHNNELFSFKQTILYWILIYKLINNNDNIYWISKNITIPKIIKYYSDVFNINLNLTYQNPCYELLKYNKSNKNTYYENIVENPDKIKKGTYDFIVLEFYKREHYDINERNQYHIFIIMLYTFYYIISSINNNATCIIITRIIGNFYPLIILELFFKCFDKVEYIKLSELNLIPFFHFDFPIKLYGFKKEKTEWFLKKCKKLMDIYPFEFSGSPKYKTIPKYSKILENKIIKYNHFELNAYYETLLKIENDIKFNLINQENNLRDAILLCEKYELPLKKWVPTKKFGEDEYGIHLLSTMYSSDNNIKFKFNKEDDTYIQSLSIDFEKNYKELVHKLELVGIPIEYVDIEAWYNFNRIYRWYEGTLNSELKKHIILVYMVTKYHGHG